MIKKICTKKIKNFTYILRFFESDNQYIIYKQNDAILEDGKIHHIPIEAIFNNEKDARAYLKKL